MEHWELEAREAIRDLVARYNANGDTGRFAQVLELFADDAVMELSSGIHRGIDEISTIFTGTRERVKTMDEDDAPAYLRHFTATHQIDLVDRDHAKGRCYYQVVMHHGLDHWGRYIDEYTRRDGRWLFLHRRVTVDGFVPGGMAAGRAS